MAVIQISKIQVRRGRALTGTGFPQLASGEMGWAIDTQELYIGSGAVSEGAPAVDNIKILTEKDFVTENNLLALVKTVYKSDDPSISTGPSPNLPVFRTIQARLNDRVSAYDFGAVGDYDVDLALGADDTAALQRAINQLFLNQSLAESYNDSADGVKTRVILEIPAGRYKITSPLYIPSYATLVGAGPDKTIIEYMPSGTPAAVIQFVNDSSLPGQPNVDTTLGITQPRNITLKGLSIVNRSTGTAGLLLDCVKNSTFEDLIIEGNVGNIVNSGSRAVSMSSISSIVTCENNNFNRITVTGYTYAVYASTDIINNSFKDFYIYNVKRGFGLGETADGSTIGKTFGPRETLIANCKFKNVKQQGINCSMGSGNIVENCKFENVGNDGGNFSTMQYPQIYFGSFGNTVTNVDSDRFGALRDPEFTVRSLELTLSNTISATAGSLVVQAVTNASGYLAADVVTSNTITLIDVSVQQFNTFNELTINGDSTPSNLDGAINPTLVGTVQITPFIPFIPVVAGHCEYKSQGSNTVEIIGPPNALLSSSIIKLPVSADASGSSTGAISYQIDYIYNSDTAQFSRRGTINIGVDVASQSIYLTDEYDFLGIDPTTDESIKLDFTAKLVDNLGNDVSGASEGPLSIIIDYTNSYSADTNGLLSYSYTAKS